MKKDSKYYPLYAYLRDNGREEITLTLAEIEAMIPGRLPASAQRRNWWSNSNSNPPQAVAWSSAGYQTAGVDLENGRITFRKANLTYTVRRQDGEAQWDAALVKALRQHMGLTQGEFAQELGVRQATISEWETGAYVPKRSTSKLLSMVAERAHFEYE